MNKKTVFDKHLYKEGMRSLLPFGAILLGLLSVFSILFSTGSLLDVNGFEDLSGLLLAYHTVLYFAIIVLVVPILSLKSFHFLTTRNGSDFYHSIPHKKQCLFITSALAIFTWVCICTIVPGLITTVAYIVAGNVTFTFLDFIVVMLHILVAALLVMSAISIACAITGTMLTNIIATGLILFFPRVFLYACRLILSGLTNFYLLGNGFLFGTRCNLVVQSIIGFENNNYYLFNIKPLIYTLLLCIAYLFLAMFLFERRHSELAMKPTLSKRFQAFICILLGTSFSLIPIAIICVIGVDSFSCLSDSIFMLVTLYVLIIIAMGIYELLSTKKARNLINIIPRTGILAVINLVLIGALFCGKNLITSDVPDPSEIKSVSFGFTNPDSAELFSMTYGYTSPFRLDAYRNPMEFLSNDYFSNKANTYATSDEAIRKIVANGLKAASQNDHTDFSCRLIVTVNTGLRSLRRAIYLTADEYSALNNYLLTDKEFLSIYRDLPKTNKLSLSYWQSGHQLERKELSQLYQLASEEMATLSPEEWRTAIGDSSSSVIDTLTFITTVDSMHVTGNIAISPLLPKTYDKYFALINSKNVDMLKNANAAIRKQETDSRHNDDIEYEIFSTSDDTLELNSYQGHIHWPDQAPYTDFVNELIQVENATIDPTKKDCSIIRIAYNQYNERGKYMDRTIKYIQLDNKALQYHNNAIQKYEANNATNPDIIYGDNLYY